MKAEQAIRIAYKGPCLDGPVRVTIVLAEDGFDITVEPADHDSHLRGDIDNYSKTILDALNKVAWKDDRQITELRVFK